jgi:hypothetical protein
VKTQRYIVQAAPVQRMRYNELVKDDSYNLSLLQALDIADPLYEPC